MVIKTRGAVLSDRALPQEPDWAVTSINLDLNELLKKAKTPCLT